MPKRGLDYRQVVADRTELPSDKVLDAPTKDLGHGAFSIYNLVKYKAPRAAWCGGYRGQPMTSLATISAVSAGVAAIAWVQSPRAKKRRRTSTLAESRLLTRSPDKAHEGERSLLQEGGSRAAKYPLSDL